MNDETQRLLREPFPPGVVGKLPRVWCKRCKEAAKAGRTCDEHRKVRCRECRNNITDAHLHLDYVGHAEVTDRLLKADPEWTWEPLAYDQRGLPLIDDHGGMWIKLTVCGTTRIGYGDAEEKDGADAVKVVIGNAIRLAAMRFGVALDLWGAKFKDSGEQEPTPEPTPEPTAAPPPEQVRAMIIRRAVRDINAADEPGLDILTRRYDENAAAGAITADDAVRLRRMVVARLEELRPAGEQAATEGDWPEPAKPGQGDPA